MDEGKGVIDCRCVVSTCKAVFYYLVMSPNYGRKPKLNKNLIKPKHFEHFTDEEMHTAFEDLKDIKHLI